MDDIQRILKTLVGILYVIYEKSQSYGTAFAIAPQILLTCAHNIYNIQAKENLREPSQIIFIPNRQEGQFDQNMSPIKAKGMYFIPLPEQQLTNPEPRTQELALIILQQPLNINRFIKIGKINQHQKNNDIQIITWSMFHPLKKRFQFHEAFFQKQFNKGKLCQSKPQQYRDKDYIACYTHSLKSGSSGSPGIMIKDGQFKIVFIHTHKAKDNEFYSLGLQFIDEVIKQLSSLLAHVQQTHRFKHIEYFEPAIINMVSQNFFIYQFKELKSQQDRSAMEEIAPNQAQNDQLQDQSSMEDISQPKTDLQIFKEFDNFIEQFNSLSNTQQENISNIIYLQSAIEMQIDQKD